MNQTFLVAPDFSPEHFSGWYLLNTLLQNQTRLNLHLHLSSSHDDQALALDTQDVAFFYANPFNAVNYIQQGQFKAFLRPKNKHNEMLIATAKQSPIQRVEDIKAGMKIAITNNHDVKLIGLRLLEVADLTEDDVEFVMVETYQSVVRTLLQKQADVGFFMTEMYNTLTTQTQDDLKVLVQSDISALSHVLLININHDDLAKTRDDFLSLHHTDYGKNILNALGIPEGFESVSDDEVQFMFDLMETLKD